MNSKVLIIETVEVKNKFIDAHIRNAVKLKDLFRGDLVILPSDLDRIQGIQYDHVIFSYGSYHFKFKPFMEFVETQKNAKFYWLTNEYNLAPNGSVYKFLRSKGFTIIANFVEQACKVSKYDEFMMINLNTLLFDEPEEDIKKKYDLIYYGTFRPDRIDYFKKYFNENVFVSTSTKNFKRLKAENINARFIKKLNWKIGGRGNLSLFRYSLYIEDKFTHDNFNYLANRFYEAVSNKCVLFFDKSCKGTIEKSNLDIDKRFIVDSYEEIQSVIDSSSYEELYQLQSHFLQYCKEERDSVHERLLKKFEIEGISVN